MRRASPGLFIALAGLATAAAAADRPVVGPVPEWVQPTADITPGAGTGAAVQVLLSDQQVRFSPTATEYYVDNRIRIQTPQGLQSIGTVALGWQPDADVLTVHRLNVRRGSQVRDLLGNGDGFTILRREDLLEQATLTGTLTAILQPSDLQVGDIVEFSYTRRHTDPVVPDKPDLQFAWFNSPVQVAHFRAQWPEQMAMRWQLRDFQPELRESTAGGNRVIDFTLQDPPPLLQPTGAPARYAAVRRIQLTAFQSWQEVSKRFAPLYAQAAKLTKDSPLHAEIERIRKASTDPKERAAAALRLAQEQVRYVLLAMNQGALVPASADQTWQRRYGDCKAKTALLLALLQGLGIEADAVMVNTVAGDGLDRLLPAVSAFDHVLVRARISGKTYWLDGTRPADRHLEQLRVPDFGWGLPLAERGSELVHIQPAALTEPQMTQDVSIDASAGVDAPVPVQAKVVFRGDAALGLKLSLDNSDATQRDQGLRDYWRNRIDGFQAAKVASTYDENAGTLAWTAEGMLSMDWDDNDYYEIDGMFLGFKPDFTRPAGTDADAPYAVSFPEYVVNRVTVKLPRSNPAFTIYGEDIDTTLAGWEYKRKARLQNGVLTAEASSRSLVPEVSAKDARAAEASLRGMYRDGLYIQKPDKPETTKAPASALEYLGRGQRLLRDNQPDQAFADLTRAIEMDPGLALAYMTRASIHQGFGRLEQARADFEATIRLEPRNALALGALGLLSIRQQRLSEAIDLLTRALGIEDNVLNRRIRASAYESSNQLELALADHEAIAKLDPADSLNYTMRGTLLTRLKRPEAARALAAEALASRTIEDPLPVAAGLYAAAGDRDKARNLYSEAIAKAPSGSLYTSRAMLSLTDPESAAADLVQAMKLDPPLFEMSVRMLVSVETEGKKNSDALRILDRIEATSPGSFQVRLGRGQVLASMEQTNAAQQAFALARTVATEPTHFNSLCWDAAVAKVALEDALRDCDTALARAPTQPAYLDSRGFVLLRLERYQEAIASFDAAIARNPRMAASLFARGIAKLRLGRQQEGEADIAAASAIDASIEQRYEVMYDLKR